MCVLACVRVYSYYTHTERHNTSPHTHTHTHTHTHIGMEAPWQGESRGGWDKDGNMIIGGNEIKKQGKGDDSGGGESKIIW